MKNKKILIILILIVIITAILLFVFFNINTAKNFKIGNNTTSQEIVDNILNISSYEAIINVEIISNKNNNKYILKQQYVSPDICIQEVLEPTNIAGVKITKNENQLKIENTKLNLSSIYENYQYISDNILDLNSFIQNYINENTSEFKEENNQILMKTSNEKFNKSLYIEKTTGLPTKMEIKDTNKNTTVYILYNEVTVNSLEKQNILAFNIKYGIKEI